VEDHGDAVPGEPHVELDPVCTELHGSSK
jgi:hypothetical protein